MVFHKYEVWFMNQKNVACLDSRFNDEKAAASKRKHIEETYGMFSWVHVRNIPEKGK